MTLKKTTAQTKIRQLRKRIRIVKGGTSASKTFSIIPFLIEYALSKPKQEISVVAETIPHLRRGALRDFLKIMDLVGMYQDPNYNKSSLTYTFNNGSFIEFFSADNPSKLRGARRDVLFINECNNVQWESYYQLAIRTRKFIYLDYNPVAEFWVDTELANDPDAEMITLTYKDNEALDESIVREIEKAREKAKESAYWANWWNVYGLGLTGTLQGVVFDNWQQVASIPTDAKFLGCGLDFGFTNDPTAAVEVYSQNGELWVNELLYTTGLTNSDIYARIKDMNKHHLNFVCDSAEPKSIEELRRMGMKVEAAKKGPDSIRQSIDILRRYKINVTKDSTNLIKELRQYKWRTDKDGKTLNEPVDFQNHGVDATRYLALNKLSNPSSGKYAIAVGRH